jgi:hypothetical protein
MDMCEFPKAGLVDGDYAPYLQSHPVTDRIRKDMAKVGTSVLTITY